MAFLTAIFSFAHFVIKHRRVTPIIGMALLMSGCMDLFHTFAANRLIEATSPNTEFIPFTWAICRSFNALIMITGVLIILTKKYEDKQKTEFTSIFLTSLIFMVIAWSIIQYCATSEQLPKTMYPNNIITRPWDLISLFLFLFAGLLIFPIFYERYPSIFSASILISTIPQVATQAHMAFGSTELYDHHFNVAHFLKIISYLVACIGLFLDYIETHTHELQLRKAEESEKIKAKELNTELIRINKKAIHSAKLAKKEMNRAKLLAKDLSKSNEELEKFAYIASHDLKAPLKAIDKLSGWIEKDLKEILVGETKENMQLLRKRVKRLQTLLNDLLKYSRVGHSNEKVKKVNCKELINDICALYDTSNVKLNLEYDTPLPIFKTYKDPLEIVFRNLIYNAIKHHDRDIVTIKFSVTEEDGYYKFSIKDDGPGIPSEYHNHIFEMFKTLKSRDEVEGSGMGLAIARKKFQFLRRYLSY